jgi:4-amino-4-deoxy-L-arabinose transferase-like glycosyltransferase
MSPFSRLQSLPPLRRGALIALAFAVVRLLWAGHVQLAPDEAYYWEWSRSLDWCYYDQGPMLALAIRAGTALLGSWELGVRLAAVLGGLAVSAFYLWLCAYLGRPRLAPWLVLAANSLLLFSAGAVLMMHDSLLGVFWCLALGLLLEARRRGRLSLWLGAGLASGLACLSKYTGLLLPLSLLGVLLAHPAWRPQLRTAGPWLAALAGGLLAGLPILGWNHVHHWPSFAHVGSLAGADPSRRSFATLPEFLASQFGLVTPVLFVLLLLALREQAGRWRKLDADRALLLGLSLLPLLFFTALSLRTRVEGNWPAPAYLAALPLIALWLEGHGGLWGRAGRWAVGVALFFSLVAYSQAAFPWIPFPAARQARLDSTLRLDGWRELAQRVESERAALGPTAFVGARTYQNAAELAFYRPGQERTLILQKGEINHQYRFWNDTTPYLGRDAVLVVGQAWEVDEMRAMFRTLTPLPDHVFLRGGREARRTQLYIGRHYLGAGA